MKINKQNLELFREQFKALMEELEAEWNIKVELKSIRYDERGFKSSIEVLNTEDMEDGQHPDAVIRNAFESKKMMYGLQDIKLESFFMSRGETFKIVGAKWSKRKYPIIAENISTGKRYCFTCDSVKKSLT